jgi:hypothetical protein
VYFLSKSSSQKTFIIFLFFWDVVIGRSNDSKYLKNRLRAMTKDFWHSRSMHRVVLRSILFRVNCIMPPRDKLKCGTFHFGVALYISATKHHSSNLQFSPDVVWERKETKQKKPLGKKNSDSSENYSPGKLRENNSRIIISLPNFPLFYIYVPSPTTFMTLCVHSVFWFWLRILLAPVLMSFCLSIVNDEVS